MDYFGDGSKWNVDIQYIHESTPLGTGGALGLLPDDIPESPVILSNGDLLTQVDFEQLMKFHNKYEADATMCVREYSYQVPFGVISGDKNRITDVSEKPTYRHFVNAGIYVIAHELLSQVSRNKKMDMTDYFTHCIAQEKNMLMFPIHEYWLDIGRHDDLKKANQDILNMSS